MMDTPTSSELRFVETTKHPENTPRAIEQESRTTPRGFMARTLAPVMMTSIIAFSDPFSVPYDMTALVEAEQVEEPSLQRSSHEAFHPQDLQTSEAETANRTRLTLLARQYVQEQLSTEDDARLAIVTERVRRLIPRVTADDFEALEYMLQEAARIEASDNERRQRLGIV